MALAVAFSLSKTSYKFKSQHKGRIVLLKCTASAVPYLDS